MNPEVPARTNDILIWLVPTITTLAGALGGWLISWWRHRREVELARAREEGRELQLGEERRHATERMFERLERVEKITQSVLEEHVFDRLDRAERIGEGVREVLIQRGMMMPSGTQANAPNPLRAPTLPRPISRPPPMPKKP